MAHPIHKHMHTHITKQNVKAAIRDDKAHMDYLKRDVKDDQRAGGKYKDINQTADEKHISKLAGDVKYDEKKEGMSRESSYEQAKNLMKYNPVDDRAGMSRYKKEGMSRKGSKPDYIDIDGDGNKTESMKKASDGMSRKSKTTEKKTVKVGDTTIEVDEKGKFGKIQRKKAPRKKDLDPKPPKKDGRKELPKKSGTYGVSRKISKKAAERKVKKGKGKIEEKVGGKNPDARYVSNRRQKRADKAMDDGTLKGFMKGMEIKSKARKIK
tara:strand:- start:1370 stop:2170 length:801 start_codon:yes stop_codon:yes gene_type:complete